MIGFWPIFLELLQVRQIPISTRLEIVVALLYTGQMPFLTDKQQSKSTER